MGPKGGAGRRGGATAAVLAATVLTLTACGGSGRDAEQAAPPSPPLSAHTETVTVERDAPSPTRAETTLKKATETATVTAESDGYVAVDPADFVAKGYVIFQYSTGGSLGECAIGDRGVSCQGSPGGEIPDVKVPGFTKGRATSVSARPSGVDYAVYADMPVAKYSLQVGTKITYRGSKCWAESADALMCSNSGNTFWIKGAARAVSTNVQPKGEYFSGGGSGSGSSGGSGNSGGTTRTKADSSAVKCREGQKTWQIVSGDIGCAEAVDIGLRYMGAVSRGEGEGNTAYLQMGKWACSSPTYARSKEINAAAVCERKPNVRVHQLP